MKFNTFFRLFSLSVFFYSCNIDINDGKINKLNIILKDSAILNDNHNQVIIVTRIDGCGICVENTVEFMKKNLQNPYLRLIVSGKSNKRFKMFSSKTNLKGYNVIVDNEGLAIGNGLVGPQPIVFFLSKKNIIYSYSLNPSNANSIFIQIKDFISQ